MDEKEYSLKRIPKHQEVAKSTKDNFFGIWADKDLDASAYVRKMRQGRQF